jgi:4-amino-4-deoxy-L-arabinose transferase-like glycosyltransferase
VHGLPANGSSLMIEMTSRHPGDTAGQTNWLASPPAILAGIILAACWLNYLWLSFDARPPHWDAANHLLSALNYRDILTSVINGSAGSPVQVLKRLLHVDAMVYPPLFPLAASVLSPTLTFRSLVMVNSLFVALLLLSVYQIGRRIHGESAGLIGAALIAAYPMVTHLERDFMVDFSLLAMTGLSAYLLLASDDFRVPRMTVLFGLSTALGLLVKPTYATFIAVPAAYTLIRACAGLTTAERPARIRDLARLAAALAVAAFVVALWYIPNWSTVHSEAVRIANSNPIGFDVFDANALVYYLNILMIDQIGLPFMGLFIFGLTVIRRRVAPAHFWFLVSWLVGLYVTATLAPYKGTGQDIAILIPVSVVSAVGLAGLGRWRRTAVAAVLTFAVVQAVALSLPESMLASRIGRFRWAGSYQTFPAPGDWQIRTALRSLGPRPLLVRVVSDDIYINGITIGYYARSEHLPLQIVERYGAPTTQIHDADIVITKSDWSLDLSHGSTRGRALEGVGTASLGVMYTRGNCTTERPDEPLANVLSIKDRELQAVTDGSLRSDHPYVRGFPLPDGSQLVLYSKQPFGDA